MLYSKLMIFAAIFFLFGTLAFNSFLSTPSFNAYAVPPEGGWNTGSCGAITTNPNGERQQTCCWKERTGTSQGPGPPAYYCQTCIYTSFGFVCEPKEQLLIGAPEDISPPLEGGVLEQPPTPPRLPSVGENVPLDGVFEQSPTGLNSTLPPTGGGLQSLLSNGTGAANLTLQQQPPVEKSLNSVLPNGTQNQQEQQPQVNEEATLIEQPTTCPPGSIFNSDIDECLLENPPQPCPDGSLPQSSGNDGVTTTCSPFELEQSEDEQETSPDSDGGDNMENTDEQETTSESDGGDNMENTDRQDIANEGQEQPSSGGQMSNSIN